MHGSSGAERGAFLRLQRLAWRSDACVECEGGNGEDLSGGYFEAGGSYLKFSYPLAFTITNLAWGVVEYRDGYAKVQPSSLTSQNACDAASLVS